MRCVEMTCLDIYFEAALAFSDFISSALLSLILTGIHPMRLMVVYGG